MIVKKSLKIKQNIKYQSQNISKRYFISFNSNVIILIFYLKQNNLVNIKKSKKKFRLKA